MHLGFVSADAESFAKRALLQTEQRFSVAAEQGDAQHIANGWALRHED